MRCPVCGSMTGHRSLTERQAALITPDDAHRQGCGLSHTVVPKAPAWGGS